MTWLRGTNSQREQWTRTITLQPAQLDQTSRLHLSQSESVTCKADFIPKLLYGPDFQAGKQSEMHLARTAI